MVIMASGIARGRVRTTTTTTTELPNMAAIPQKRDSLGDAFYNDYERLVGSLMRKRVTLNSFVEGLILFGF